MSGYKNATAFFHACESLQGWEGCAPYVAPGAGFRAQSEPLINIQTVEQYTEWMAGLGSVTLAGCHYDLHSSCYDEETRSAIFFATFYGTHVGDGGPVPPTGASTSSDYVYIVTMNLEEKVSEMCKVWNAPWALRELGWS